MVETLRRKYDKYTIQWNIDTSNSCNFEVTFLTEDTLHDSWVINK